MSRDIPAALQSNLADDVVYPFFAVELNFDTSPLRLWTGVGTLSYLGNDWVGSGELLTISSVEETSEIAVRGATLTLSGVPSEVISLALTSAYQGRVCNIYLGTTTKVDPYAANGISPQLVADLGLDYYNLTGFEPNSLTEIFTGYMDQMNINEGPDTSTVELKVENRLIDLERARVARFTSGYQKSKYPGDLGLDFVESLQDRQVSWGKATK